jgi:hypothetical protein
MVRIFILSTDKDTVYRVLEEAKHLKKKKPAIEAINDEMLNQNENMGSKEEDCRTRQQVI